MNLELYFLRSSEQKIVSDMLYYAQRVDESDKSLQECSEIHIYDEFYGLTPKDLGVYAMVDAEVAGAIWSRRLSDYHNSKAFIDNNTPVLNIAVKPTFRSKGVATAMMEQFLQEAATLYDALSISVPKRAEAISFFEKFGFEIVQNSQHKSYCDEKNSIVMIKKLQRKSKEYLGDEFTDCKWLD